MDHPTQHGNPPNDGDGTAQSALKTAMTDSSVKKQVHPDPRVHGRALFPPVCLHPEENAGRRATPLH